MKIPIIINNRNLLTYPRQMLERVSKFDNVGEIIIVDNSSTYLPLLNWYETNPCKIIKTELSGHLTPWYINLLASLNSEFYIVTDPDLDLTNTPLDTLTFLYEKMIKYPEYDKIGLSLSNWNVSEDSPYHEFLKAWSSTTFNPTTVYDELYTNQQIDTVFAMYNINRNFRGSSCATIEPYSAKHIPWEYTNEDILNMENNNPEYYYYLTNANNSSSYKSFINFNENTL